VRSAHHHRDTGGTKGIRNAVSARDHPGQGTDTDQIDGLLLHEADKLRFVHRLRVAVEQDYFVWRWSPRMKLPVMPLSGL
jgi:hypothetical protein